MGEVGVRRLGRESLGETKVQYLDLTLGCDLDVGRLQIPMDDPLPVRRLQRLGDLAP